MPLTFFHVSDTHLGYSNLDAEEGGVNVREEDFFRMFDEVINRAVQEKPGFVLHSGDIFERSAPTNRVLVRAHQALARLTAAGIPFYLIAGNHDLPKSSATTPIHTLFHNPPHSYVYYSERYETLDTPEAHLHFLPHINSDELFAAEAGKIAITQNAKPNIIALHLSVGKEYLYEQYGERIFPPAQLPVLAQFDYAALGHWHSFKHLKNYGNVYYAGATERMASKEAGQEKGFVKVTIGNSVTIAEFIPLPIRPMYTVTITDCASKEASAIYDELKAAAENFEAGAMINVEFIDTLTTQQFTLSRHEIEQYFLNALELRVSHKQKDTGEVVELSTSSFDLRGRLMKEITREFTDLKELSEVQDIVHRILNDIEEEEANADQ